MVASVLVQLSNKNIDKTFDYLVPSFLEEEVKIGKRVQVPFGKQVLEGFVLALKKESECENLKSIQKVIDEESILNEELLYLGKWMQKNTMSTLINCYQVMLPKALKAKNGVVVSKKYDTYLTLTQPYELLMQKKWRQSQREILDKFQQNDKVKKEWLNKISASSVKTLLKQHILKEEIEEVYRYQKEYSIKPKYPLTIDQQKVVEKVLQKKNSNQTFLLHGVTGSGKTEVYMELIESVLKEGKSSIVLVPEISLTPQIVARFQSRFGENIAVLHSRLSDGEKYDEWRKIARGEVKIVIGARSAIFAPLENIGMIIVDEEHSTTYKQENNPKYHAIDVAKERSRIHNCPLVLGSATPSLESYARAMKEVYQLVELPKRVNQKQLPKVSIKSEAKRS